MTEFNVPGGEFSTHRKLAEALPDTERVLSDEEAQELSERTLERIKKLMREKKALPLGPPEERKEGFFIPATQEGTGELFARNNLGEFHNVSAEYSIRAKDKVRIVRLAAQRLDFSERVFEIEPDGHPTAGTIDTEQNVHEVDRVTVSDELFAADVFAVLEQAQSGR